MLNYQIVKYVAVLGLSLHLTACGTSFVDRRLKVGVPPGFLNAKESAPRAALDYPWWQDFEDPTLNSLVNISLAESPSLAIAMARVREADAQAKASINWPSGSGELGRQYVDGVGSDTAEASFEWSFFAGKRKRAAAALERLRAAEFGAASAYLQLISAVANAYVELRFLQQIRILQERDLGSRQRTLGELQTLFEKGLATRLDVVRADALVAETKVNLAQGTAEITAQKQRLSTLTGRPLAALGVNLDFPGNQPIPTRLAEVGIPADLVRSKPEIRQAEALYSAAVLDASASNSARFPSLTLSGNILVPLSGGSAVETALAGVALPIFQQPALAAQVDAADARAVQAYSQWTQEVLVAVQEVESALAAIGGAQEAISYAQRLVKLNNEALSLSRELFRVGDATVIELLDSERSVTAANSALATSRKDQAQNVIALYQSLGVGVPRAAGQP